MDIRVTAGGDRGLRLFVCEETVSRQIQLVRQALPTRNPAVWGGGGIAVEQNIVDVLGSQGFGAGAAQSRGIWPEPSLWPGSGSGSSLQFSFIIHVNCMVRNLFFSGGYKLFQTYFNTCTCTNCTKKYYVLRSRRRSRLQEKNSRSRSRPITGQLRNPGSQECSFYCFICEFFNAIPLEREIRKKFAKK